MGGGLRRTPGLAAMAFLSLVPGVVSQELVPPDEGPLVLARTDTSPTLDGRLDDAAWAQALELPTTLYFPVFRGEPRERTTIRVLYDDEAIWFAGWFYDSEPSGIRINSLYRDRWNGDDAFAIYLDAFNDNRSSKWFGITPAAVRFDLLVNDDGASTNASWDAVWDARTTVTEEGWFAEVRIPFSTLGFQTGPDGRVVMGLTVTRLVSRTGERVTFPAIDPAFEFRRPSVARDVVMEGVTSPRPVRITPYLLAARDRSASLDEETGIWRSPARGTAEAGLDVRYTPSPELTLDLTANTDFAQVEADDQQIALDRFPLFFPEKRRFFQEGSGLFEFPTGSGGQLFHSRRIGLTDDRRSVPVLGGARLVGRMGAWDIGILDMQTRALDDVPSENLAVARVQRGVLNDFSTAGAMVTARVADGRRDLALGIDGSIRVRGDDYLTARWAGTTTLDEPEGTDLAERSVGYLRWQRRVSRGLAYSLEAARQGPVYDPGLGFLQRRNFTTANLLANWYLFADDASRFRRVWPGMLAFSTFRNGDGSLESGQYAVWLQWETKAGGGGWIEPKLFREDVRSAFELDRGVGIPVGDYTYADLQINWTMPAGRRLRTSVDFRAGTFFDGTRIQLTLGPTWNASPHLELGAEYRVSRLRFEERGQAADLHLARFRVRSAWDARLSANAFVQYNSVDDRADVNLRVRYNFSEGTDLWLVFNEGYATELRPEAPGPARPRSLARSVLVKYTFTFGT